MLGLCHNVLGLDTADLSRSYHACKERIFAEGVVAASEGDVAIDIDERLQCDVDTQCAGLTPDHDTIGLRILETEGGSDAHCGRLCLAGHAGEQARRSVGKAKRGDMQAWHAREVAGLALVGGWIFYASANEIDLFFKRHLLKKMVDASLVGLF